MTALWWLDEAAQSFASTFSRLDKTKSKNKTTTTNHPLQAPGKLMV